LVTDEEKVMDSERSLEVLLPTWRSDGGETTRTSFTGRNSYRIMSVMEIGKEQLNVQKTSDSERKSE